MKEPIADRNISILTKDQLEDFIKSEKIKGKNTDYDDLLYVESDDYTDCYGIYLKQTLCGYICVYKNNPSHCDKLYISSDHRRKGLAHFALDFLGVTSVWVLTKNKVAMDFYTSIGFKINSKHGEISVMGRKSITNKSLKADFTKW